MLLLGSTAAIGQEAREHAAKCGAVLVGSVPYREVPEYMAAMDVLLQHPIDIGNGLRLPAKLAEYLAMGKPVITYAQGFGSLLEHGRHAMTLASADPAEMARCIDEVFGDPRLAHSLSENARLLAESLFDWDINCDALESIYQRVLSERAA